MVRIVEKYQKVQKNFIKYIFRGSSKNICYQVGYKYIYTVKDDDYVA